MLRPSGSCQQLHPSGREGDEIGGVKYFGDLGGATKCLKAHKGVAKTF